MKSKDVTPEVGNATQEALQADSSSPQIANAPSVEEIQKRAHEIYLERGGAHGQHVDDWLQAEQELTQKYRAG